MRAFGVGLCIAATALVALSVVALWLMPGESYATVEGKRYLRQNELIELFLSLAGRAIIGCVVVGIVCGIARIKQAWWCLVGACVGSVAFLYGYIGSFGGYQVVGGPVRKGTMDYVLLGVSFLQGRSLMIAHRIGGPPWDVQYEQLAEGPWENSFGYAPIVRPSGTAHELALLCSATGMLVQVNEEGRCYVAYDLVKRQDYSPVRAPWTGDNCNIQLVSPFALLSPSDKADQEDATNLLKGEQFAKVQTDVVRRELQSKNPEVRRLAQLVLDSHIDEPAEP